MVPIAGCGSFPPSYRRSGVCRESSSGKENLEKMARKRLGEFLLETGLLGEEELTRALAAQRTKRGKLGEVIVNLELATEQEIAQVLSLQLGIPLIDLKITPVEPQAIDLVQEKVARKHLIIPVAIDLRDLHIAMADPLSSEASSGSSTPSTRTSPWI